MRSDPRLGLIGIALRAGRAAVGTRAVRAAARAGRLAALVVATDASENAVARLGEEARSAPRVRVGSRATLGEAVGRAEVAVVGVTDAAIARRLMMYEEEAPGGRDDESGTRRDPRRQVP